MPKSMTVTEARKALSSMPDLLNKGRKPIVAAVKRQGKRVLAIMPWDLYDSLMETIEILSDEDLMKDLRQSERDMAAGRCIPWEKVKAKLKL